MKSKTLKLICKEKKRQDDTIELIASENFVSKNVMKAVGSCLTNKYSEGYPAKRRTGNVGRYYGGCSVVDEIEEYCCNEWRNVFHTEYHVNVQPHSGSSANLAAYMSVLKPGDKVLSMELSNGGHLTHGSSVNFSGKLFDFYFYGADNNGLIDYYDLEKKAAEIRPKLILAGASAYPREIDFRRFSRIAKKYGAIFMVDMSHIAGLIAAGKHQSPFGYADIITTTTHKTLRGPRGGIIFCKKQLAKKIDSAVFPCCQGGSLQHVIAGKAVAAEEAQTKKYKKYIQNVVENARAMSKEFVSLGFNVVTNGTDNHLILIDFSKTHPGLTGKDVQDYLDTKGITVNKNCVPNETRSPSLTSGIRLGTPAMTTKGYSKRDFIKTARAISYHINSELYPRIIKREMGRSEY